MNRITLVLLLIGVSLISTTYGQANQTSPSGEKIILINRMMEDIRILSSPIYQGRQAGTNGGYQSALFVVQRFRSLGLQPAFRTENPADRRQWLQQASLIAPYLLKPSFLELFTIGIPTILNSLIATPGNHFLPILDSPSIHITAPIVFVGYGIVDPARGVDDYEDIDVNNRIVLFLRGKPPFYPQWITHKEKALIAKEKGAAGFLTVTGPLLSRYETHRGLGQAPLAMYSADPQYRPIPGAWISGSFADQFLQSMDTSLETLQHAVNEGKGSTHGPLPLAAHLRWNSQTAPGLLTNVLGIIPGSDPILQHQTIVIGAHRDHFGEQAGLQFPGADDNASGTAVMLEVARILANATTNAQRTILFVSFDGEERGLLGSRHYVANPTLPLRETVAMINLDHVGIGNGKLTIGLTRLNKTLAQQAAKQAGLANKIQVYGYFPGGDHVPFYEMEVPTLTVVSAGIHPHFHQPSDIAKEIDPETVRTAARFVLSLVTLLAKSL